VVASFKAVILQKWQFLSGADEVESLLPFFYRGASLGRSYSQMLRAESRDIESKISKDSRRS